MTWLAEIEARLAAATPGHWFWNSYRAIFAAPLVQADEDGPGYPDAPRPGPPFFTAEDNAWTAQRTAAYEADSVVARVPAHYGDTATGRHAADAILIAHAPEDLARLLAVARAAEAVVRRGHPPRPADGSCAYCQWRRGGGPPCHHPRCPWLALQAALSDTTAPASGED